MGGDRTPRRASSRPVRPPGPLGCGRSSALHSGQYSLPGPAQEGAATPRDGCSMTDRDPTAGQLRGREPAAVPRYRRESRVPLWSRTEPAGLWWPRTDHHRHRPGAQQPLAPEIGRSDNDAASCEIVSRLYYTTYKTPSVQ